MKVLAIYFCFHNAITLSWIMKLICSTSHVVVVWSIFIVYEVLLSKQKLQRKGVKYQTNWVKQLIYWRYAIQAHTLLLYSNYITMCVKNLLIICTLDSVWLCEQSILMRFSPLMLEKTVALMLEILLTYRCWLQFRSSISDYWYFLFFLYHLIPKFIIRYQYTTLTICKWCGGKLIWIHCIFLDAYKIRSVVQEPDC